MLELLLRTPAGVQVEEVLARGDAVAPDLVDAEVFSGLIRARKSARLSENELASRVELLRDADVERYPARDLLSTARSCAAALSGYDALYAALATVLRLELPPTLARTFRSTNAIESMISICRDHASNVKRWRDGQMALRWCAAGMVEAGKQFRRVNGHLHLRSLRDTLDRVTQPVGATSHTEPVNAA